MFCGLIMLFLNLLDLLLLGCLTHRSFDRIVVWCDSGWFVLVVVVFLL